MKTLFMPRSQTEGTRLSLEKHPIKAITVKGARKP
jgi:hypothetical protein